MPTLYLTGSSGGLGRVIRQYYLERGWNVVGMDAQDDGFKHEEYDYYSIDSTDARSVESAFLQASGAFGVPRALVATIGGLKPWAAIEDAAFDDFSFVMNLNVASTFLCVQQACKLMKPVRIGAIVTLGAETALRPEPRKSAYVAAKAGVIALTQTVALETKEYGVNTNCIVPTVIHTEANEEWGAPKDIERWTEPDDIASLCYYLSSNSGRSINGAVIRIPNKL